jgi:hypothetical protein
MPLTQQILALIGVGLVANCLSSTIAYFTLHNTSKSKLLDPMFATGCMLVAQYFIWR